MQAAIKGLGIFQSMSGPNSKGALNAAIMDSFAHRYVKHDSTEAKKQLDEVLKNTAASLKDYWGWNMASYLAGRASAESLQSLQLNKTSKTQMRCYYAIDRSLAGDLQGAKREFHWVSDFGDREIDEFDLAMSWFHPQSVKTKEWHNDGSPLTLAPSTQAQPLSRRLSFQTFDVHFHNSEFRFQRNADEFVL